MAGNLLYNLFLCDVMRLSTDGYTLDELAIVTSLRLSADGYTLDELEFEWRNDASELQIDPDLQLPQFTLTTWEAEKCRKSYITGK